MKKVQWKIKAAIMMLAFALVFTTGAGGSTVYAKSKKEVTCKLSGKWYKVKTPAGTRKYRRYVQTSYGKYYSNFGCVITSVAIATSAFGKHYSPADLHTASASRKYGERYAVKKLGGSSSMYGGAAISLRTASKMIGNMGISRKTVYRFKDSKAIREIREHLQNGKPVIVETNNNTHNGIRIAYGHHAIVLVGIDSKDRVSFIDPMSGKINWAHSCRKTCSLKLSALVKYHMNSPTASPNGTYVTSLKSTGGYILIG